MKLALRALISGVVVFTALTGNAADDFLDKLKSATEKLQQLQGQLPQTPPTQQSAPQKDTSQPVSAGDSGTPEATAKVTASVGAYDVVGIKLGMPGKEAARWRYGPTEKGY